MEQKVKLLVEYLDVVLVETPLQVNEWHLSDSVRVESYDGNNIPALVNRIFALQPEARILVVTTSESVGTLVHALNTSFSRQKLAVYCKDVWEIDAALEEISRLENLLVTQSGAEYYISHPLVETVYATEEGRVVLQTEDVQGQEVLFKKKNLIVWGILMPDTVQAADYVGTMAGCKEMPLHERMQIAETVAEAVEQGGQVPLPEEILLFSNGEHLIAPRIHSTSADYDLSMLLYHLLLGTDLRGYHDILEVILHDLTCNRYQFPCYLLDDLERAFLQHHTVTAAKWLNTLQRIRLEQDGDRILPEKQHAQASF